MENFVAATAIFKGFIGGFVEVLGFEVKWKTISERRSDLACLEVDNAVSSRKGVGVRLMDGNSV